MPDEDRRFYEALPDHGIQVYRGQDHSGLIGLSWTLDRSVAEKFADGHRGLFNPSPVVLKTVISKADIALAVTDRKERELVLFAPPRGALRELTDIGSATTC